jgi:predicted N-acetyltransferase YhbS
MSAFERDLGGGLVLRHVRDKRDADAYVAFHARIFDAAVGRACDHLLHQHPSMTYDDFLIVEDTAAGRIVSTTCLIPWECRYDDVALRTAMLEMVATDPEYRHRSLIRAQVERFHNMVDERALDLCVIEGIPYYYRQFGYAYAVDHRCYDSLPAWLIADATEGETGRFAFRAAVKEDAALLADLYANDTMGGVGFGNTRDDEYWRFLVEWTRYPVRIIEDSAGGRAAGYVVTFPIGGTQGVRVAESGIVGKEAALAAVRLLKAESGSSIELGWPETTTLVRLARSLGSTPRPIYQWLVRIPDIPGLLGRIGPVLERRIAASDCSGLTGALSINLFRQAYVLRFGNGKLAGVDTPGFVDSSMGADGGDLCIPPDAFVRLVLGYRSLDEIRDAWPDIVVKPQSRRVLDILFPKMTSYFCMPYLYFGPTN